MLRQISFLVSRTSHLGYIDKENEVIVGLQTDAPLKRIVNLYGGKRMAHQSLEQYGYKLNEEIDRHFNEYRKTHNEGVLMPIQNVLVLQELLDF